MSELVTEGELSRHPKICERLLCNWRMRGEIPSLKIGRSVRFRVGDVAKALEEKRVGP